MEKEHSVNTDTNLGRFKTFLVTELPGAVVLKFSGRLDSEFLQEEAVPQKILYLISAGVEEFIIDTTGVTEMDSSLLGLVFKLARFQKKIRMVYPKGSKIFSLFEGYGLSEDIPWSESLAAAVSE